MRGAALARIEALRVPPAWREVHIAASPRAAVQAWGYDARGRKQYRYHEHAVRRGELRKYHRVRQMALRLPRIRARVRSDALGPALSRKAVAAGVVRLIGDGMFRIGNDRYARENGTFGITTLRKSHAVVDGDAVVFRYRGKSAVRQRQVIVGRDVARFVSRLRRAPGTRLFRYRQGTEWEDLTSRDVNDYLRSVAASVCSAKDLRTWGATLRAAIILADLGPPGTQTEARRNVMLAMRCVSAELGNTPTICRKSYVHPMIIARYLDEGDTIDVASRRQGGAGHGPEERALIRFLARHFPERRRRPRAD